MSPDNYPHQRRSVLHHQLYFLGYALLALSCVDPRRGDQEMSVSMDSTSPITQVFDAGAQILLRDASSSDADSPDFAVPLLDTAVIDLEVAGYFGDQDSSVGIDAEVNLPERELRVVGYYASWATYRGVQVTDIGADFLTHINYAFAAIQDGGCVFGDPWADIEQPLSGDQAESGDLRRAGNLGALRRLRSEKPHLSVLISVGGWGTSQAFSESAATAQGRRRLAESCVNLLVEQELDGIDLDWEFPVVGEGGARREMDREAFPALVEEFRAALNARASETNREEPYLLTIALPIEASILQHYDLRALLPAVDWVNVMAYDMVGPWSATTGFDAPLRDPLGRDVADVEDSVALLLDLGVPAEKLVLGVPFYGRSFSGVQRGAWEGLFQTFSGLGPGTFDDGVVEYRGLERLRGSSEYSEYRDEISGAAWLYSNVAQVFVTFEDTLDIWAKYSLVIDRGLGGLMAWELSQDDESHSLTRAMTGR